MDRPDDNGLRIPAVITLKDVITFVSIAVTISLAWGVFGTRLTVIENEVVYQAKELERIHEKQKAVDDKIEKLGDRVRENENIVESLWNKKSK